jgi:type II secretory pathway component PulM
MSSKHIACGIVALLIAGLIQLTLYVQGNRTKVQLEAKAAQELEASSASQLARERSTLADLKRQSADLIDFLKIWQPQFELINTAQSAEVNFSMQIRDSGLVNLAQSFKPEAVKGNSSIPSALSAQITFEDDYVQLLNWLGKLEVSLPTMRVTDVHITKGTRPTDARMEVNIQQPLMAK